MHRQSMSQNPEGTFTPPPNVNIDRHNEFGLINIHVKLHCFFFIWFVTKHFFVLDWFTADEIGLL